MFELGVDRQRDGLQALARAIEADGGAGSLKRQLAKALREVIQPVRAQVVSRLMSIPSGGHSGAELRSAVAKQTRAGVRFKGKNTGVNLVQRARGMPRGFEYAGRALNREEGWNPQSLDGTERTQIAEPANWFDGPIQDTAPGQSRREIQAVMEDFAERLAARTRRG